MVEIVEDEVVGALLQEVEALPEEVAEVVPEGLAQRAVQRLLS